MYVKDIEGRFCIIIIIIIKLGQSFQLHLEMVQYTINDTKLNVFMLQGLYLTFQYKIINKLVICDKT